MATDSQTQTGRIERWSQVLFLIGGLLVVCFGVILGIEAMTGTAYENLGTLFAGTGGALAFFGLAALYRRYISQDPWLTRVSVLIAVVGAVGYTVVALGSVAELAGQGSLSSSDGMGAPFLLVMIGMILGFLLFGVAQYRKSGRADRTTLSIIAPAVVFLLIVITGMAGMTQVEISAVLGTVHGLSYVAIGAALRAERSARDTAEPRADSAI